MNKEQALQIIKDLRAEVDEKFPENFRLNYYGQWNETIHNPRTAEAQQMEDKIKNTLIEIFESDDGFLQNDKDVIIAVLNSGFSLIMSSKYIGNNLIQVTMREPTDASRIPIDLLEALLNCRFSLVQNYESHIPDDFCFASLSIADIKRLVAVILMKIFIINYLKVHV